MRTWILVTMIGLGATGTLFTTVASGRSLRGTSQTIGNTTYHRYYGSGVRSLRGTSQTIGNTTYHSFYGSGGSFRGTSLTIGNTTYHSFYGSGGSRFPGGSRSGGSRFPGGSYHSP